MHNSLAGVHLSAVDIFEALEAGVDVFDGSYPTELYAFYAGDHSCSCYAMSIVCIECFHFHLVGVSILTIQ